MSYQWEKICPLCMEEMDLTDQQFKPCKCGYQICVWCWNHLVDKAGNDEALCPACRSPYDKEKIKAMTVEIDRLAEINFKDKEKLRKGKSKTNKANYNPDVNRVVQRNLAYIVGIPINLAEEETLSKREFFGQYGEILKIHVQNFKVDSPYYNKSSAVYVTYSKEEEAKQCIRLVDGFLLCGSLLRASYGKTRYCHLWLINKPCKNQACLYLHYDVPQQDICTKYDVISLCTSREEFQGKTLPFQRCSGSVLPPPIEKPLVASTRVTLQYNSGNEEISSSSSRDAYRSLAYEEASSTSSMSNNSTQLQSGSECHVTGTIKKDQNTKEKITQGSQSRTVASIKNNTVLSNAVDEDNIIEEIRLDTDCLNLSDDCMLESLIPNVQAMTLNTASASPKAPTSSDLKSNELTSKSEANTTNVHIGSIHTSHYAEEIDIGQTVGKLSTFPSIRKNDACNIFELHNNGSSSNALNARLNPLRLHKPASTVSKPIAPPPKTPPGIYSSRTYNSMLSKTGKLPAVNSSQNTNTSNSFFSVEPADFVNMLSRRKKEREVPHSTHANSWLYGSSLFDISALTRNSHDQYQYQNQYHTESTGTNIYLNQTVMNETNCYNNHTNMDYNVIGRGRTGQTDNYVNSETSTAHGQFNGRDNSGYQATDVNHFYSYYKPW